MTQLSRRNGARLVNCRTVSRFRVNPLSQFAEKSALVLEAIFTLLKEPRPDDPLDAEVANLYLSNKEEFETTAKAWTTR